MTEKLMKRLDEVCNEQIELVNQSHTGVSEENLQELVLTSITDNARISRGEILRACYGDSAEFKKYERIEQIIKNFQRTVRYNSTISFELLENLGNELDLIPFLFYNKETGLVEDLGTPKISANGPDNHTEYCGIVFASYFVGKNLLLENIGNIIGFSAPALRLYVDKMLVRRGHNKRDLKDVKVPALHWLEAISDACDLEVKYLVPKSKPRRINKIPEQKTAVERLKIVSKQQGLDYNVLRARLPHVHVKNGKKVKSPADDFSIYALYKLCDMLKERKNTDLIPVVLYRKSDGMPELFGNPFLLDGVRNPLYVVRCLEFHRAKNIITTNRLDSSLDLTEEESLYLRNASGITTIKLDWYCDRLGLVASYLVPVQNTPNNKKYSELNPSVF